MKRYCERGGGGRPEEGGERASLAARVVGVMRGRHIGSRTKVVDNIYEPATIMACLRAKGERGVVGGQGEGRGGGGVTVSLRKTPPRLVFYFCRGGVRSSGRRNGGGRRVAPTEEKCVEHQAKTSGQAGYMLQKASHGGLDCPRSRSEIAHDLHRAFLDLIGYVG